MQEYYNRINIYNETQEIANKFHPNKATSVKHSDSIDIKTSGLQDIKDVNTLGPRPEEDTNKPIQNRYNKLSTNKVNVVLMDTIDQYNNLVKNGYNPVLLNMADPSLPGGCVNMGASAQEENIFRRTNYFMTLSMSFYPILNSDTIYSKDVVLFRSSEETGYTFIEPTLINIIACPSIRHPELDKERRIKNPEDLELQYAKISMIFKTAIYHGHDSIVLSAFGCGAFRCPPKQVAYLFKRAIEEYACYFKKIVFAIKQPVDSVNGNGSFGSNYKIFYEMLNNIK